MTQESLQAELIVELEKRNQAADTQGMQDVQVGSRLRAMRNELGLSLKHCHFWGMDEWVVDGVEASVEHPLSFRRARPTTG